MPFGSGDLPAKGALAAIATALGESGKDAGRFEVDDGVKGFAGGAVWNVEARILDGLK